MKQVSRFDDEDDFQVRDLRQKWPAVEQGLKTSGGMLVTRGSMPVARLLPLEAESDQTRSRFDPVAHAKSMKRTWGGIRGEPWGDAALAEDRKDG